jgi:hypothetical protein
MQTFYNTFQARYRCQILFNLLQSVQKDAKWRKSIPENGQNHKIGNNSAKMAIWSLKIGKIRKQIGTNIL